MSEDRLAANLFAARKRALDYSDKPALSSMPPRIRRQYERFADELRPLLAEPAAPLVDDADLSSTRNLLIDALTGYEECDAGAIEGQPGQLGARIDGRLYRIVIVPQADGA